MDNDIEFIKHIILVDDNEIEIVHASPLVHDRPGCDTGMQLKLLDAILCWCLCCSRVSLGFVKVRTWLLDL